MGRIFVMVYRPHRGKEQELIPILKSGYMLLRDRGYLTSRPPIMMQASNGCLLKIFEWKGKESMSSAEADLQVQEHWMRVSKVCDFEKPVNLEEFKQVFSEFEAIAWDDWDQPK